MHIFLCNYIKCCVYLKTHKKKKKIHGGSCFVPVGRGEAKMKRNESPSGLWMYPVSPDHWPLTQIVELVLCPQSYCIKWVSGYFPFCNHHFAPSLAATAGLVDGGFIARRCSFWVTRSVHSWCWLGGAGLSFSCLMLYKQLLQAQHV